MCKPREVCVLARAGEAKRNFNTILPNIVQNRSGVSHSQHTRSRLLHFRACHSCTQTGWLPTTTASECSVVTVVHREVTAGERLIDSEVSLCV